MNENKKKYLEAKKKAREFESERNRFVDVTQRDDQKREVLNDN